MDTTEQKDELVEIRKSDLARILRVLEKAEKIISEQ
jgi:hypothetical protein